MVDYLAVHSAASKADYLEHLKVVPMVASMAASKADYLEHLKVV
jgi:hypothetical protein